MPETMEPDDLRQPIASNEVVVLDVRDDEDWSEGAERVPGSIHITPGDVEDRIAELPEDKRVVLVCPDGTRSAEIAEQIDSDRDIVVLEGGVQAWKKDKLLTQPSPDAAPPKGEDEPPHEEPEDEDEEEEDVQQDGQDEPDEPDEPDEQESS